MVTHPKRIAYIFPGQGSQAVGMGCELAAKFDSARQVFAEADDLLGFSLSGLMWEGPDAELNDTLNTQPALFVHSLAVHQVLRERFPGLRPAFVAGHSLGELSALAAAGAMSFADGLRLVRRRGELMKRAGQTSPGGMAAVLGLDIQTLDDLCAKASEGDQAVQVANDNCPGQVVISGARSAVERAIELAKQAGARRALPLAVSIAAHSPLMLSAQKDFDLAVANTPFGQQFTPVISNLTAEPMTTVDALRTDLRAQLTSRVRWSESVRYLVGQGVGTFLELGSGSVLVGLLKRIDEGVEGLAVGAPSDIASLTEWRDI
jgi:[acyl-carrier-protein] S-malonyltransferase